MKIIQPVVSLVLALSLSSSAAVFARSHHKKTEETPSATTSTVSPKTEATTETNKIATEEKTEHHKRKERKRHLAAVPTTAPSTPTTSPSMPTTAAGTPKTEESKPAPGLFNLFRRGMSSVKQPASTEESTQAPANNPTHEGMEYVHGYTKKNGTVVRGYWRRKPHEK